MKRLIACTAIVGMLLNAQGPARASGPGTTAADILKIGVGPGDRMGEAYVAPGDDVSSLYWNPPAWP